METPKSSDENTYFNPYKQHNAHLRQLILYDGSGAVSIRRACTASSKYVIVTVDQKDYDNLVGNPFDPAGYDEETINFVRYNTTPDEKEKGHHSYVRTGR